MLATDEVSSHLPFLLEGRYEGGNHNQAGIGHQSSHLGNAANVFNPVSVAKSEIFVKTLANIVTIQNVSMFACPVQGML